MSRARDLAAFVSNADGDIKFDTDTLFIDSSANRVGIGTTTPSEQINLVGSSGASKIRFDGDSSNLQNNFIGITGYDDLIIASDEANSGSASTIQFKVDGSERMRIDDSGNVGIAGSPTSVGTGVPTLNLKGNDSSQSDRSGGVRFERQDGTAAMFISHLDGDNRIGGLSTYPMTFRTNNVERLRILDGGGLTFNGDTAAANALDDYETGNWTPTLVNGGSATNNYASYVKIGDLVTASAYISASSIPNNSSQFQIGGLPFTAHSNSNYYAGGSLSYSENFNTNVFTDPLVRNGNNYLYFHRNDGNSSAINNNNITGATRYLIFQVTYHTQIP